MGEGAKRAEDSSTSGPCIHAADQYPPPPLAFVNSTSMCGLELKWETFSKAVFCWLRVRLLVYMEWATFICSQVKFIKMAQMLVVPLMPQESHCHSLSRPGQAGQPAMCVSGSLSECMVLGAGVHR